MKLVQMLGALKKAHPALNSGSFTMTEDDSEIFAFGRINGNDRITVRLNLGTEPVSISAKGPVLMQNACADSILAPFGWCVTAE